MNSKLKEDYFRSRVEEVNGDSGRLWSTLKQLLGSSSKSKVESVMVDGVEVTDKLSVVNAFNDFFSSIGVKLARNFTPRSFKVFSPRVESEFKFHKVTSEFMQKALRKLSARKATGLDGISSCLLKAASDHIHVPLTFICNL